MTSPQQLEIPRPSSLSRAEAARPLLEQQAEFWNQRPSLGLQTLHRVAPPISRFAASCPATSDSTAAASLASAFASTKVIKRSFGDIYASRYEAAPLAIVQTLTRHILETLEASTRYPPHRSPASCSSMKVSSRPSSPPPSRAAPASRSFRGSSFRPRSRRHARRPDATLFRRTSNSAAGRPPSTTRPPTLIQHAYLGHPDADINDQYRTLAGSQRFLHNIIRFPGCGTFDPDSSFVLRTRRDNILVARACSSRASHPMPRTSRQLCVLPDQRGRRLGASLLHHVLRQLPRHSVPHRLAYGKREQSWRARPLHCHRLPHPPPLRRPRTRQTQPPAPSPGHPSPAPEATLNWKAPVPNLEQQVHRGLKHRAVSP